MWDTAALYAYVGVFVALVASGLGFPIPEELPILGAGAMVGHAAADNPDVTLRWWIMLPVCILGVVIGDGMLYGMGRFWGPRVLETRWLKRILPDDRRQKIEGNFHKYGVLVLLFARILPTIRSPIFIMAGVMRLPFTKFVLADGIYAVPGVSLLFALAYFFGDSVRDLVLRAEGRVKSVVILVALTGVAAYLFYHFFRHPVATGDPKMEMPLVGSQIASKMGHEAQPETPEKAKLENNVPETNHAPAAPREADKPADAEPSADVS